MTGALALPTPVRKSALLGAAATVNVVVAAGVISGKVAAAVLVAILPALLLVIGGLMSGHRAVLAFAALGLDFTSLPIFNDRLPLGGGAAIYCTDVILLLAIGGWAAERLTRGGERDPRQAVALAVTWPLPILAVFVTLAVVHGHNDYGLALFGQPVRLILYAGIAVALLGADARSVWRGITVVFYAGAVIQFFYALYYLATGGSQTDSVALSTGGTRILALSTATYLVGSLVCALLNLERERDRPGRQFAHAVIAGLATFGIIVSYGRTTYAAVAVIIPVLLVARKPLRRSMLWLTPLLLPIVASLALIAPILDPSLVPTLTSRVASSSATDINVIWRVRAREVSLEGLDEHLLTGIGFGRPARFRLAGRIHDVTGDPHNSYVYLLAGGGILALGSLLAVMLAYLIDVARRFRRAIDIEQTLLIWSLCTWFAFAVNAYYGPVLTEANMLMTVWILMILPQCVLLRGRNDSAAEEDPAAEPASA